MYMTVDQDATLLESRNQAALRSYEGERGYQPMLAVGAEMNLVLADEFRDGNVPAQQRLQRCRARWTPTCIGVTRRARTRVDRLAPR